MVKYTFHVSMRQALQDNAIIILNYNEQKVDESWSFSMPLYPQSVASQGACPTPYSFAVFTSHSHLSL
jgi:hypothetical protein